MAALAHDYQFWLLGYEFPATLMLFTVETLYIVTTVKKGNGYSFEKMYARG